MENNLGQTTNSILESVFAVRNSGGEFNEVCDAILDVIGKTEFVDIHCLHIIKEQKNKNLLRFDRYISELEGFETSQDDFLEELSKVVINTRSSVYNKDIFKLKSKPVRVPDATDIIPVFSIPVIVDNNLIGVAHFSSHPGNQFSISQRWFLHSLTYVLTTVLAVHERFRHLAFDQRYISSRLEKSRFIVENRFDLIMEAGIDGKFIYVNQDHERILGYSPSELVGANIFKYIHPEDVAEVIRVFGRGMGTLSSEYVKFRYRTRDGRWLWLESLGNPYRDSDGVVRALVASREL